MSSASSRYDSDAELGRIRSGTTNLSTQLEAGQLLHLPKERKKHIDPFIVSKVASEDDNPTPVIEWLIANFLRNDGATPAFFIDILDDAVYAELHPDSTEYVRLMLSWWWVSSLTTLQCLATNLDEINPWKHSRNIDCISTRMISSSAISRFVQWWSTDWILVVRARVVIILCSIIDKKTVSWEVNRSHLSYLTSDTICGIRTHPTLTMVRRVSRIPYWTSFTRWSTFVEWNSSSIDIRSLCGKS